MAVSSQIQRWGAYDGESESGFRQYKNRVYGVPQGSVLSDFDLQEGDNLPDDSNYEIISASIEMVKPLTRGANHKGGRAAVLNAVKERTETSTGGWAELVGTRRVLDSDPQTMRYQVEFTAGTGATVPSPGDTLSDLTGGSLSSTGLDREPVVVFVSDRVKATIQKDHVTCVFQAHHARTTAGGAYTEINPRMRVVVGRNRWRGRRRFSAPIANAASLESSLYGSIFPGLSGKYAPKCNRVETHDEPPNMPGRSLVIADYETPRVVGEGRLRIKLGAEFVPSETDISNVRMAGPEKYDTDKVHWGERRIIRGDGNLLRAMSVIVLETAADKYNLNTFMNRVGCVNRCKLPNFGNAQPGTLLFLGQPDTTFEFVDGLWHLNLAFKYSGDPTLKKDGERVFPKWNDLTESQLGTYQAFQLDVTNEAGTAVTGSTGKVLKWVPATFGANGKLTVVGDKKKHPRFPEANFRDMGKNLLITGI